MSDRKGNSLSPEPCALIPVRPKAASMTSGRGWPGTGRDHHQAVSASVMDGGFAASNGGVR